MAKYDKEKYEVSDTMPERFAQSIPGLGIQHFTKKNLTDNDCKALVSANSIYVKQKLDKNAPEYAEDNPEYKDI